MGRVHTWRRGGEGLPPPHPLFPSCLLATVAMVRADDGGARVLRV
jgi:hypothetical protein